MNKQQVSGGLAIAVLALVLGTAAHLAGHQHEEATQAQKNLCGAAPGMAAPRITASSLLAVSYEPAVSYGPATDASSTPGRSFGPVAASPSRPNLNYGPALGVSYGPDRVFELVA